MTAKIRKEYAHGQDHSHKSAVEPTGGSTLEVVDVDRKPSYPVAALEPKHVEPHSFDSMTQVVTYLRDKLRDTPLVSPEESAAEVFKMLNRDLTQTERDALFKAARQGGASGGPLPRRSPST